MPSFKEVRVPDDDHRLSIQCFSEASDDVAMLKAVRNARKAPFHSLHITEKAKHIVSSNSFQVVVFVMIIVASVLVGLETYQDLVERHGLLFNIINATILFGFVAEIILRILAYGRHPLRFFADGWNLFDFVIVFLMLLPIHAEFFGVFRLTRAIRLIRVLKAMRILRLIDIFQLQFIVDSLFKSLPPLGSIALLLSLHFYVFSVIGTFLFHDVVPAHFGTLHHSLFTLFTILTLEGSSSVLKAMITPNDAGQAVSSFFAAVYIISFMVIGTKIVLNLIIGTIVRSMSDLEKEEKEIAVIRRRNHQQLTPLQEIDFIENQIQESMVCLRLLRKAVHKNAVGLELVHRKEEKHLHYLQS